MKTFSKRRDCPSSEIMLSYLEKSLSPKSAHGISLHATNCDFCGGELQLLAKYPPKKENDTPDPTSDAIHGFASGNTSLDYLQAA